MALVAGHLSGVVQGRLLGREPTIPLEAAKMSTTHMSFDDGRARAELGLHLPPGREALARAAHWFVDAGYVRPERVARLRLDGLTPVGCRRHAGACTVMRRVAHALVIGSDHAGFVLKGAVARHLPDVGPRGGGHRDLLRPSRWTTRPSVPTWPGGW